MNILAWPAFKTRSRNPYNYLLYSEVQKWGVTVDEFSMSKLLRSHYDIVHIHWPEKAFLHPHLVGSLGSMGLIALLRRARLRGTRVVWTVHNLQAHARRRPYLEHFFWKVYPRFVDAYITLTPGGQELARDRFPALGHRPGFVIPHGHYRDTYPNQVSSAEARAKLDIDRDATVIAFVGSVRPYKNVPQLIRTFRELDDGQRILLIAGKAYSPEYRDEVLEAAAGDPRVRLFLEFVPEDEIQLFFNAADLVVLSHTEVLNSGSALLALSFNRPVLLPDKGVMRELQAEVGGEWIKLFSGELDVDALRGGLAWALRTERRAPAPLDHFEWRRLARDTVRAYLALHPRSGSFQDVKALLADIPSPAERQKA